MVLNLQCWANEERAGCIWHRPEYAGGAMALRETLPGNPVTANKVELKITESSKVLKYNPYIEKIEPLQNTKDVFYPTM
jgi:hypothetical protein